MPGSSDGACQGLIAIVGPSYSGSTLLNALLGSHPLVAGGGELSDFAVPDADLHKCAFCGDACPIWTAEVVQQVANENIYDVTARAFGRPFVCDSSKGVDWFKKILPMQSHIPQANILLVKHPLRHVSSHVQKARHFDLPQYATFDDYRNVLLHFHDVYATVRKSLKIHLVVKYEDLVANPRAAVSRILALHGLRYAAEINFWQAHPHHHIGGNAGPRSQIAPDIRPMGEFLQRKYARNGIFLDNSFRDILTEDEFRAIQDDRMFKDLCAMFGYKPLPRTAMSGEMPRQHLKPLEILQRARARFLGG